MENSYLNNIFNKISNKYSCETEYLNSVLEFLESIDDVIDLDERFISNNIVERLIEPERIIQFRITWVDDFGNIQVNRGYRVQHSSLIGPYKGGIRFDESVDLSIVKFLAFEQTLKNSLTTLPLGGAKGGADFNPKGKSDGEIMRFCQSFMSELYRYIGPSLDIPAGDLGVGEKEIGYMYGYYKKLQNQVDGAFTSKGLSFGGSLGRKEATGYGLCYFTNTMLGVVLNDSLKNKRIIISGSGNVGLNAARKATELGAVVIAMSDSSGMIYNEDGLDIDLIYKIKSNKQPIIFYDKHSNTMKTSNKPKDLWEVKCDIALPCATQNELDLEDAISLVNNKVTCVIEGANKPTTKEASSYLIKNGVLFGPSKAANAGGVVVSSLEMTQNTIGYFYTFEEVDMKLNKIMEDIFNTIYRTSFMFGYGNNFLKGANIASFLRLSEAMIAQGII